MTYLVPERKWEFFVKFKENHNFNHRHTWVFARIKILNWRRNWQKRPFSFGHYLLYAFISDLLRQNKRIKHQENLQKTKNSVSIPEFNLLHSTCSQLRPSDFRIIIIRCGSLYSQAWLISCVRNSDANHNIIRSMILQILYLPSIYRTEKLYQYFAKTFISCRWCLLFMFVQALP